MPLNPLDYLHVAARAANAFRRRYPFLDPDVVRFQARLIRDQIAPRYDPARCPDPVRFLAYTLQRSLIDWFRQHAPRYDPARPAAREPERRRPPTLARHANCPRPLPRPPGSW